MPISDRKDVFVWLLSNVTQGAERAGKFFQEIGQLAEDPMIKEAMEARAFLNDKVVASLNQCFKMIGATPVQTGEKAREVFFEDFKRELKEIQSPEARRIFILAKVIHFAHLRIGEYSALVAASDLTGHPGVGVLIESCLADKLAMADRTRRFLRNIVEERVAERRAA